MRRRLASIPLAAVAVLFLGGPAGAIMVRVPLEELAQGSDLILQGTVRGQASSWNADQTAIVTDVLIDPVAVWVGSLPAALPVRLLVPGGEVPPIGMRVEDQPHFDAEEEVVLFLVRSEGESYVVSQQIQGKFSVASDRVIGHDGVSYPIDGFRVASVRAHVPGGYTGEDLFPTGEQGPPLADDNNYLWSGQKWFPGRLPYTWRLNQNGAPGCTVEETRAALASGFDTWMCASGVSMTYGGTTNLNATNHSDLINVLAWEVGTLGSGTIALCTWIYYVGTGEIIEIDIQFNAQHYSWSCAGLATAMDVGNIGTHEIGHTLALLDMYGVNDTNKTMYGYSSNGETSKRTLLTADALGDEFIYPHTRANFVSTTPGGWYNPLVPRNTADATGGYAPLPAQLVGNATSYINAAMTNNGGDCASPSGLNNVWLDHVNSYWTGWWGVWGQGYTGVWTNLPHWVIGGRHTLSYTLDDSQETLESNEGDNAYSFQYVWSPLVTYWASPNVRPCPPTWGIYGIPNSDGMSFTRNASYAWVTSLAPWIPGDDYDLYLYDDYAGSLSGFSNLRATSAYGGNYTDFVVGHYSGTPTTVYPAAIRYAISSAYYFSADQIDASGRNAGETGAWGGQYLADYRVADVYEGYFTAGSTYRIHLLRESGSADIAFNVYPGTGGGIYGRSGAAGVSNWVSPTEDGLDFTATTTGWHPIVVYRNDGSDQWGLTYSLWWNPPSADLPDRGGASSMLAFHGAVPNPIRGPSKLVFQLPAAERVRLDLYDSGGRHLRSLFDASAGPGLVEQVWDGKDGSGRPLAAGNYWARLVSNGERIVRLVTVLP